ncbi:MAG: hypothetical protein IPO22_22570 [Anaerolineales bacterium]|nr:hypothetical protein [Anaerolineales bacterium]
MRRNQLMWGVVLLLVGVLMLANSMGVRLPNGKSFMDLFWPLLLILLGGWILFGIFFRGTSKTEDVSIELQGARKASLKLSHGAGEFRVHSGAGLNEYIHATITGGVEQKVNRDGDKLDVKLRPSQEIMGIPFIGSSNQLDWDVAINADIPTVLKLNLGANKSVIDLHDLNITDLKLEIGASETQLTLPAKGRFPVDLDFGAASLTITIPDGLAARIKASLGAADIKVDESRFPRSGGYYQSPDYETAINAADITIDAGAASIKIK